jgi:hypothetical protein
MVTQNLLSAKIGKETSAVGIDFFSKSTSARITNEGIEALSAN